MRSSFSSAEAETHAGPASEAAPFSPEWKQEANHRLAAHRARRGGGRTALQGALPGMGGESAGDESGDTLAGPKLRHVADRVAARYAKAPTYSDMLAAEARNAARAAEAAAIAASEARDAAQAILVGLDASFEGAAERVPPDRPLAAGAESVTVAPRTNHAARLPPVVAQAVDVEPEWTGEESVAPAQPLPAKLLEFPRELIAARKARPRLAEGPLREDGNRDETQLRIFEVEAEAISTEPVIGTALPGWSAIRLDPHPAPHEEAAPGKRDGRAHARQASTFDLPLQTASLEDRLMAALVDLALVAAGFLIFVLVFCACTAHPPTEKPAMIGAGLALFVFAIVYQLLFFSFGQDTPGMRYAKIALCTFDDENPTRKAARRRLGSLLLSASPFGLGILWAFFDHDRLGWHDRISRTYQRSYR